MLFGRVRASIEGGVGFSFDTLGRMRLRDPLITTLVVAAFVAYLAAMGMAPDAELALSDTDDAMRVVQVIDLVEGQAWGDLTQHRLADGVGMHWTRHLDVLVAPFVGLGGFPDGVRWATVAVPGVLLAGLLATLVGWWGTGQARSDRFILLLASLVSPAVLLNFLPGRMDHHGLQILLAVGGAVAMLRSAWGWGGVLLGTSLAIGLDALPALAGLIIALGIGWIVDPARWERALRVVPGAVLGSVAVNTLLFAPDGRLWARLCDVFALPLTAALAVTALVCAVGTRMAPASRGRRLLWMAAGGVGAGAGLALVRPACLAGPLVDVPDDLKLRWLDNVTEARSWPTLLGVEPWTALTLLVPVLIALGMAAWALRRGERTWLPLVGLLAGGMAGGLLQIRGLAITLTLALCALPLVTGWLRSLPWQLASPLVGAVVVAGLLVANGFLFLALGTAFDDGDGGSGEATAQCKGASELAGLAGTEPGLVLAHMDLNPAILLHTPHRVLTAPYHRNVAGMREAYRLLDGPTTAHDLAGAGVSYVVVCDGMGSNPNYTTTGDTSLMARLLAGDPVDGLVPVDGADGPLLVWTVSP